MTTFTITISASSQYHIFASHSYITFQHYLATYVVTKTKFCNINSIIFKYSYIQQNIFKKCEFHKYYTLSSNNLKTSKLELFILILPYQRQKIILLNQKSFINKIKKAFKNLNLTNYLTFINNLVKYKINYQYFYIYFILIIYSYFKY